MSTNILKKRIAALGLDSLMSAIAREGEGIDEHEVEAIRTEDKVSVFRSHLFDYGYGRQVIFNQELIYSAEPWTSVFKFQTNPRLTNEALCIFDRVVRDEKNLHTIMFYAEGDTLMLGPFFYRNSRLRDALREYIEFFCAVPPSPVEVGQNIWRIIQNHGGLTAILAIWDDLFESTILPQILMIDPYCLDD